MSRRRLEAEAIRDAILAVSGELDPTMGGTLLTDEESRLRQQHREPAAPRDYDVNRRSVYLPVIRSGLYDVFQAFDFADPSASNGKRIPTTVAPQALFMMNDPLVLCDARRRWRAACSPSPTSTTPGRIRLAYLTAYGRPPTEKEIARAADYLRRFEAELESRRRSAPRSGPSAPGRRSVRRSSPSSEFLYLD